MIDVKHGKLFEFTNCYIHNPIKSGCVNLYQVGELGLESGGAIFAHAQICHEISYVVSGEGMFYTGDKAIPVSRGDIHVVSRGLAHRIEAGPSQRLRYIYLGFDFNADFLQRDLEKVRDFYLNSPLRPARDFGEVRVLLDLLINELYARPEGSEIVIESLIHQVLIYIYRLFSSSRPKQYRPSEASNLIGQTAYKIIKYIDGHIFDIDSVKTVAKNLSYNESYISHLFKEKTGLTIQEYIRGKKMEAGAVLLKNRKLTVTEISEQLNYDTPQAFAKAFKRHTGYSPTEYRNRTL